MLCVRSQLQLPKDSREPSILSLRYTLSATDFRRILRHSSCQSKGLSKKTKKGRRECKIEGSSFLPTVAQFEVRFHFRNVSSSFCTLLFQNHYLQRVQEQRHQGECMML